MIWARFASHGRLRIKLSLKLRETVTLELERLRRASMLEWKHWRSSLIVQSRDFLMRADLVLAAIERKIRNVGRQLRPCRLIQRKKFYKCEGVNAFRRHILVLDIISRNEKLIKATRKIAALCKLTERFPLESSLVDGFNSSRRHCQ